MTEPEKKLWFHIRNRFFSDIKFRRQYSVGKYILDFYIPKYRIGIEVDGDSHVLNQQKETEREIYLKTLGIKTIHYTNRDVLGNIE